MLLGVLLVVLFRSGVSMAKVVIRDLFEGVTREDDGSGSLWGVLLSRLLPPDMTGVLA